MSRSATRLNAFRRSVPALMAVMATCACSDNASDGPDGHISGGNAGTIARSGAGGSAPGTSGAGGSVGTAGETSLGRGGGQSGIGGQPGVTGVELDDGELHVDGQRFVIRGVCWNPVAKGASQPADFVGFVEQDAALMKAAGINTVRTYAPITERTVLDQLYASGIRVIQSVYAWGPTPVADVVDAVERTKDHPAVLFWSIGNEWNYNGLYVQWSAADSMAKLNEVATAVRASDPSRPIATIYGELPKADVIAAMPDIDVWGINVYRGIGFGDLFDKWTVLSDKPMFISEYGADAWDARTAEYAPDSQAEAVGALTTALLGGPVANKIALGGTVFEWADEWWKDQEGQNNVHDVGGAAPGSGPYPDSVFNEEWWGIVDIDRTPRPAYDALKRVFAE